MQSTVNKDAEKSSAYLRFAYRLYTLPAGPLYEVAGKAGSLTYPLLKVSGWVYDLLCKVQ